MGSSLTRILSFFSKWAAEIVRQPALMVSLVIGPFLILLAFGQGVKQGVPTPRTILVFPPGTESSSAITPELKQMEQYIQIVDQTTDIDDARDQLEAGDADLVIVIPPNPLGAVQQGQRAPVVILMDEIDPVQRTFTRAYLREQVATLNQQTVQQGIENAQAEVAQVQQVVRQARQTVTAIRAAQGNVAEQLRLMRQLATELEQLPGPAGRLAVAAIGAAFVLPGLGEPTADARTLPQSIDALQQSVARLVTRTATDGGGTPPSASELEQIDANLAAIDATATQINTIPAWVLSAPFEGDIQNIASFVPTYIAFFAPAVLALLLQHLAMTLGALSMTRVRLLGLMEVLQTSPLRPVEAAVGNYLSFGVLCAVAGGLLVALLHYVLDVPVFGSWTVVAVTLALLTLTSLGIGFVISMLSSSEQQAAQIAMLALIATVFFAGFVVPTSTIGWPIRTIAYMLPASYAIRTLQDVMLRGDFRTPLDLFVLGGASVVFFFVTVWLFRREYRAR